MSSGESTPAAQTSPNKRQSDDNPEESNKKQKLNNGLTVLINSNANPTPTQGDKKPPIQRPGTPTSNAKNSGKPLKEVTELDTEIASKYDKIWKDVKTYVAEKYLMVEKLSKSNKGDALSLNIKDEKGTNEVSSTSSNNNNNPSRSPSPSKLKTSAERSTTPTPNTNTNSNSNETKKPVEDKKVSAPVDNKVGAGIQVKPDPVQLVGSNAPTSIKPENIEENTINSSNNTNNNVDEKKEDKESGSILLVTPSSPLKLDSLGIGDGNDSDDTIMLVSDSVPVNKEDNDKEDENKSDSGLAEKMELQ